MQPVPLSATDPAGERPASSATAPGATLSLPPLFRYFSRAETAAKAHDAAALDGSSAALDYSVDHCMRDVLVLEKVVGVLKAYSTQFNALGSGY